MRRRWHVLLPPALALFLLVPVLPSLAATEDDDATVVHVLNRLGYGPRPGDVEAVRERGVRAWIERQLQPERIDDDALKARLASLPTLRLSTAELLEGYALPREAREQLKKRMSRLGSKASEEEVEQLRREVRQRYADQMEGRPGEVIDELQAAKLIRAVHSERQLDEVLVDFWMDHFQVSAAKGLERYLLTSYERDVIRPRAWGRFEDLLRATAESPALLYSLENWLSVDPEAAEALRQTTQGERARRVKGRRGVPGTYKPVPRYGTEHKNERRDGVDQVLSRGGGLNEAYARALLERHTLGAGGSYSPFDVTEVARCFTGWTIFGIRELDPRFVFEKGLHDRDDKVVMDVPIRAGGKDEGERVLSLLASDPATARSISLKLARRFVSDEPPPALVERAVETFNRSKGEIREVLRTILESREFLAPETRGAKHKTPLEFVASAVRAAGAEVESATELARRVSDLEMPLYLAPTPKGYSDAADAWNSPGALSARHAFAADLAAGRIAGVRLPADLPAAGQILGSPEFQRK
jgi:uncharacterized protein (DUF1800 family)